MIDSKQINIIIIAKVNDKSYTIYHVKSYSSAIENKTCEYCLLWMIL